MLAPLPLSLQHQKAPLLRKWMTFIPGPMKFFPAPIGMLSLNETTLRFDPKRTSTGPFEGLAFVVWHLSEFNQRAHVLFCVVHVDLNLGIFFLEIQC